MREFEHLMKEQSYREINVGIRYVRITNVHFEQVISRVEGSLNKKTCEEYDYFSREPLKKVNK